MKRNGWILASLALALVALLSFELRAASSCGKRIETGCCVGAGKGPLSTKSCTYSGGLCLKFEDQNWCDGAWQDPLIPAMHCVKTSGICGIERHCDTTQPVQMCEEFSNLSQIFVCIVCEGPGEPYFYCSGGASCNPEIETGPTLGWVLGTSQSDGCTDAMYE